jgi:hypothetical protein
MVVGHAWPTIVLLSHSGGHPMPQYPGRHPPLFPEHALAGGATARASPRRHAAARGRLSP